MHSHDSCDALMETPFLDDENEDDDETPFLHDELPFGKCN
jgi:hypothetical protein